MKHPLFDTSVLDGLEGPRWHEHRSGVTPCFEEAVDNRSIEDSLCWRSSVYPVNPVSLCAARGPICTLERNCDVLLRIL